MTRAGDEEAAAIRADERAVENLRRVRAARREQPWAVRVNPPESHLVRCGCWQPIRAGDGASACTWCRLDICYQCRVRLDGKPYCRRCAMRPVEVEL